MTFLFEGTVTQSCELISLQACATGTFGSGVEPGTAVTGSITFNPNEPVMFRLEQPGFASATYNRASVELTIGSSALTRNAIELANMEVDATETTMGWTVRVGGGFQTGQVAGLPIHFATIILPIAPSRYPNVALLSDPEPIAQGLRETPERGSFSIKHIPNPAFRVTSIDLIAPGPVVTGRITSIRRQ